MPNKILKKSLKKYDKGKENKPELISGQLGIPLNGQKLVEVPNRSGFVYVRLKGNTSELIQAYNAAVPAIYDLPVFVVRTVGVYKVVGRNIERNTNNWGGGAYLPKHGAQHSFNHGLNIGGDIVWVWSQQFMPMLSYPSGSAGSMSLAFEPSFYEWQGQWKYAQNTGTPSYAPYVPTITGSARMVLSYIDPSTNSIKLVAGTPFDGSMTGSAQIASYIPDIPRSVGVPLAAVRLTTGTTALGWDNIYDVRDFFTPAFTFTGSIASVDTIGFAGLDEGVPIGTGTMLNVTGDLSITRSGTMFNLSYTASAPGGGGGNAGIMGWDEGALIGTGTVLNVTGPNLALTISGTVLNLNQQFHGIRAYHTGTNQSAVTAASGTSVLFNFELFDTDGYHSTTVNPNFFTVPAGLGGKYQMGGGLYADANCDVQIRVNGTKVIALGRAGAGASTIVGYVVDTMYQLNAGDYVQLVALGQGGARNVYTDIELSPHFWMYLVG